MTIRLLEKVSKHSLYAKALGIEVVQLRVRPGDSQLPDISETNCNQ